MERSLWIAGGTVRRLISPDAMKLLIARSGGIPGTINRLMEAVFNTGFARSDAMIGAKTVKAAMGPMALRPGASTGVVERLVQIAAAGWLVVGAAVFLYKALSDHVERPSPPVTRPIAMGLPPMVSTTPEPPRAAASADPLSAALVSALMKRGDQSLALGDIAAARQLFERAAGAGNAAAATALGKTYDPNFVAPGGKTDAATAVDWYRKAAALGDPRATDLLKRLGSR